MATKTFIAKVPLSVRGEGESAAFSIVQPGEQFKFDEEAGAVLVRAKEAELLEEPLEEEDYTSWKKDALIAEVERRGLVIESGSGVDGGVLADDLRLALVQDDIDNAGPK